MSPKEKAIELVLKFKWYSEPALRTNSKHWSAKQCALIAIDEILKVASSYHDTQVENFYWQQVKTELENL